MIDLDGEFADFESCEGLADDRKDFCVWDHGIECTGDVEVLQLHVSQLSLMGH